MQEKSFYRTIQKYLTLYRQQPQPKRRLYASENRSHPVPAHAGDLLLALKLYYHFPAVDQRRARASPVVLRQGAYTVIIYTRDHPPAHVHVKSATKEARVRLNPVEVTDNWGFRPSETRAILKLIQDHQRELLDKWAEIYPGDKL